MKMSPTFEPVRTALLGALIALPVACGYSARMSTPVAGTVASIATLNPDSATARGRGVHSHRQGSQLR
jgi:hypothetical protein